MLRAGLVFSLCVILSLAFHLFLGGDTTINYQQVVVKVNLLDLFLGVLLVTNLLAVIYIARKSR